MGFLFDSGSLFAVSQANGSNPTPVKIGSLEGIEANVNFDLEFSPLQFQAAIGATAKKLSIELTAKTAQLNGLLVNQILFGQALTPGSQAMAVNVAATSSSGTPPTCTPAVPSGGTWAQDMGVQYSSSGLPLYQVASAPAQGQYSVSAGIYTFNAADASTALTFCFLYTMTTGSNLVLNNKFKDIVPYFQAVLQTSYGGDGTSAPPANFMTWNLNRCASVQLKFLTMVNKMAVPEFKFTAMADLTPPYGTIGTLSFSAS